MTIRRSCLDLSLEGGFCLLVKLKELEKLTIWSQSKELRLLEKDLSWIGYYEDATVDGKGTAVKRVVQAEAVAVSAKSTVASKTLPPSTKNIVSTTTTTTAAAVAATNAGPTTTATISIATEATAGINARTLSPLNPRATTTFTHNNPITTVNNRSNKNPANNNPTITTTSNTDSNPGAISSSKGERTRRKIKSFLRRVSSDSSSSSQTSTSLAITQAAKFEPHCHNIPTNIKAVYKSDNDWFLTMIKTTSPQKALPSPSQPAPALEPPFANKGESVYPCWPHLRTITWAVNPEKLFKDDKAATVFSTLRPDINFKVQQYIE
ncbi:hypothetical protein EC991_000161 [Linnemannia zychae]|nr:hypothetical protein EC991_000161 [Linnemannia zychae]